MVRSGSLRGLLAVCVALAGGIGQTQPASQAQMGSFAGTQGYGTMNLQSNLGTFRSIDGEGRFDIAFKGSLLVSKLEGKVTPVGAIKKEYDKYGRQVYFGEGRLVVEGKWRAIQWFGTNMRTTWYGKGIILILGEFDKDLNQHLQRPLRLQQHGFRALQVIA